MQSTAQIICALVRVDHWGENHTPSIYDKRKGKRDRRSAYQTISYEYTIIARTKYAVTLKGTSVVVIATRDHFGDFLSNKHVSAAVQASVKH